MLQVLERRADAQSDRYRKRVADAKATNEAAAAWLNRPKG